MLLAKYGVKPECFVDTETFLVKKIFFLDLSGPTRPERAYFFDFFAF